MFRMALFAMMCGTVALIMAPADAREGGQKAFDKAVKKVEGAFTPAEAKPGQTVTFTVTVELNEGFHTYPVMQTDPGALNYVTDIKFPKPANVIFVGDVQDPKDVKVKPEPDLKISEFRYCEGKVVFSRKAVVSPKAMPGPITVKLDSFILSICDKDHCYPPKKVPVEATLKVLDAPAVPIEKEYAEEVKKAMAEK